MDQAETRSHEAGTIQNMIDKSAAINEEINGYEKVEKWLAEITPKEREVLSLLFGLEGEARSPEEIGHMFGISLERVKEIETVALTKLRRITNMQE